MVKKYFFWFCFLFGLSCQGQIINIPDANFKAKLLQANTSNEIANNVLIDANANGEIELSEALLVKTLDVNNSAIASLEGIQFFTDLHTLKCNNNNLTTLNVNTLIELLHLNCSYNALITLNVEQVNNTLRYFDCSYNNLTSLTAPNMFEFEDMGYQQMYFNASHNQLSSITFPITPEDFSTLDLSFNNFTSFAPPRINIYDGGLNLSDNPLVNLNLDNLSMSHDYESSFAYLALNNTNLAEITIPPSGDKRLKIMNNPNLVSINLKNGRADSYTEISEDEDGNYTYYYYGIEISNNPQLGVICCDNNEEYNFIYNLGLTDVQITPYCTLIPGGNYNTISGTVNMNCPLGTPITNNIKVKINNLYNVNFLNESNSFTAYTNYGNKVVSLQLEHPSYFTVSPPNYNFNFINGYGNAVTADFCVAANGVHPDVAVSIIPTIPARPGFNANYDIIFTNNGTELQSGIVNLNFNDALLDFVLSTPMATSQVTNALSWAFTDLAPFESRTISVTLNVNSPMETPAVNIGDVFAFTASISNPAIDETPQDNSMTFNQTVVGSFDPNDKTVLEGPQISSSQAAGYLNYVVRFQNTGTFAAENIVVFDRLNNTLDPATLEIIGSSHPFRSSLFLNFNVELEVFFEGINLPPSSIDEAGSQGYIAFRAKPYPYYTSVGSVIENTAYIYFDYNFPIVTNTATTTVTALGTNDFDSSAFTLYPNPTENQLQIGLPEAVEVKKISISNALGQKLLTKDTETVIDVSTLAQGTYFISIETNKGKATKQFIKI